MDAHDRVRLKTMKLMMRMWDEEYGRSHAKPPLEQHVPGHFFYRGDHSHIRCSRCHVWLKPEERNYYIGHCKQCEEISANAPVQKENAIEHYRRMENGMVLSNSCNYERWS